MAAGGSLVLDFAEGHARFSILVIEEFGGVYAYENTCPHARMRLETFDGRLLRRPDGPFICAAHIAVFEPATGACIAGPAMGKRLTAFPIEVREGAIFAT